MDNLFDLEDFEENNNQTVITTTGQPSSAIKESPDK